MRSPPSPPYRPVATLPPRQQTETPAPRMEMVAISPGPELNRGHPAGPPQSLPDPHVGPPPSRSASAVALNRLATAPMAREKLQQMLERQEERAFSFRELDAARRTAHTVHQELLDYRRRVLAAPQRGAQPTADANRRVQEAGTALARLDERLARLKAQQSPLPARLVAWVQSQDMAFEDQPIAPAPTLPKGQTWPGAVTAVRDRIAELGADVHAVQSAPLPSAMVKDRLRAQVDALAARGTPNVLKAIEIGRPIDFVTTTAPVSTIAALGQAVVTDAVALLAWLDHDRLLQRLEAEVDALADDEHALTDEQRAQRERQLAAEILTAEREEEALIEAAELAGVDNIARRADASAIAVLGLVHPADRENG